MNLLCDMKEQPFGNIIFYGTPAYGHIHPTLFIVKGLVDRGYHVVYYAIKEFQSIIEKHGAEFREYTFEGVDWNPQVGSRILELTELILRFTNEQMDVLISEARRLQPALIFHDTIAFWGRTVASELQIKAVCVNTLVSINGYGSNAFRMYATRFMGPSIGQWKAIPNIMKYKRQLKKRYKIKPDDWVSLLMNPEKMNVYTYPARMHPDGERFDSNHFFLGPTSLMRSEQEDEKDLPDHLIFVSLGTIFNDSPSFYQTLIQQFGNTQYHVVVSCKGQYERLSKQELPNNIVLKSYVNQLQVLKKADLFIGAGGMNSICEAVSCGVPCLIYPQQGEQDINGEMVQRLGLGMVIRKENKLLEVAEELLHQFHRNEELIQEFSTIHMEKLMKQLEHMMNE